MTSDSISLNNVTGGSLSGSLIFSATNLPPGLQINSLDGSIFGKPLLVGEYSVKFFVSDQNNAETQLGSSLLNVTPVDDCDIPDNGPNGLPCTIGICVDGEEFDNKFTCNCTGFEAEGENCDPVSSAQQSKSSSTTLIAVSSGVGGFVLFAALLAGFALMRYRRRVEKDHKAEIERLKQLSQAIEQKMKNKFVVHTDWDKIPFKDLAIDRNKIVKQREIGHGAFGEVNLSLYKGTLVAVKSLLGGASREEQEAFMLESRLLHALKHDNIVNFIGHCTTEPPLLLVLEYMPCGDLRAHLHQCRPTSTDRRMMLSQYHLLNIGLQIGTAMKFLEACKVIHRDLAARNVLVLKDGITIKLGDFGLSREISDNDYYRKNSDQKSPVKWMALESIKDKIYTSKSDVWSFGVFFWEVMSLGMSPYGGLNNLDAVMAIASGHRLQKPEGCKSRAYQLMKSCWLVAPEDRPNFGQITQSLKDLLLETEGTSVHHVIDPTQMEDYTDLEGMDGTLLRAADVFAPGPLSDRQLLPVTKNGEELEMITCRAQEDTEVPHPFGCKSGTEENEYLTLPANNLDFLNINREEHSFGFTEG